MKIYTNELGHMTNMAAMPIYGKNLTKSLILVKGYTDFKVKTYFSQKQWGDLEPKFI